MAYQKVARVGNTGHGFCNIHGVNYTTTFTTGSSVLFTEGQPVCIIGTLGTASCGHTTIAVTGSTVFDALGQALHRVGDMGYITVDHSSTYVVDTGSNVLDSQ